jgi:hypothetical protein
MNSRRFLVPVFIRNNEAFDLLTEHGEIGGFSRLMAALKRRNEVIVTTDSMPIEQAARSVGVETILIEEVVESESDILPLGWRESGDAFFNIMEDAELMIVDFLHPAIYTAELYSLAEKWLQSNRPVAFSMEESKDHPCQIEICYPKCIEAISYQPVRWTENESIEIDVPLEIQNIWRMTGRGAFRVDECWVIPVFNGCADGDQVVVITSSGKKAYNTRPIVDVPSIAQHCLLLWLRETQEGDDPLMVPLEMNPKLWKVGLDGVRYLLETNQPITGRQLFPKVLQLSLAIIMANRAGWQDMRAHLDADSFYPLIIDTQWGRDDSEFNAVLGLLALLERFRYLSS